MANESRVLVIYCGGTIGMLKSYNQGYVPVPYYLTETLRAQSRFHDPHEDSLFSHSSSVQGFEEWSQSGRSSPAPQVPPDVSKLPALLVRSSRPITVPRISGSEIRLTCIKTSDDCYEAYLPSLVTPGGNGKRIRYVIHEWHPLLDSSNLEPSDWVRIATEIELNYTFDAFVILHGTDTMAYSSSALSFLLEDLGKTVILTGAQIPLSQLRNDAVDNLLGALCIAGQFIIPECSLFFNHTLYRGNRVSKSSSSDLDAFSSPNFPPLVNVGTDMVVNWNDVLRQPSPRKFNAHKKMCTNVATLRLFPGITSLAVRAFVASPMEGIVLETFGSGNAPNRPDLLDVLQEACSRGVVIVAISQCAKGSVSDAYETGRALLQVGVVPGGDMTPECALTKLGYLLSKPELSREKVRDLVRTPLRGEITLPPSILRSETPAEGNLENVQDVLSQILRVHSSTTKSTRRSSTLGIDQAAAPWSWTNTDTYTAESALLPLLIHLAAARDDKEALSFCINFENQRDVLSVGTDLPSATLAAGLVNVLDASSGKSPLHVAALHGNTDAIEMLLTAGASVHIRDLLDHTALYYAARQGHEMIVEKLVEAGALLGGSDIAGDFVSLAVHKSKHSSDPASLRTWLKAGADIDTKSWRNPRGEVHGY